MRLSTIFAVLVSATSVSTASLWSGQQKVLNEDLKVPGENPLYYCSDPKDDILKIRKVDLDPNPPKAGQTLKISATGNVTETIEKGAKVRLQVKYGPITLIKREADFCEQIGNVDLECPLEDGPMTLSKDADIPKEVPSGTYSVEAEVFTKDEKRISCLKATVVFS